MENNITDWQEHVIKKMNENIYWQEHIAIKMEEDVLFWKKVRQNIINKIKNIWVKFKQV